MNKELEYIDMMKRYIAEEFDNSWERAYEENDDILVKKTSNTVSYEKMLTNVMEYLESAGGVEFAILKDPELGKWWAKKVKIREEKRKKDEALEKLKSTMTKEELKILGINVK